MDFYEPVQGLRLSVAILVLECENPISLGEELLGHRAIAAQCRVAGVWAPASAAFDPAFELWVNRRCNGRGHPLRSS